MYRQCKKDRNTAGFTMVEILVGSTILAIICGMVAHWFFMQRRYQERVLAISESQQSIRQASWNLIQELRTGRNIISPRLNVDKSIKSDTKLVFKNFSGEIVCYYHDSVTSEIRRCLIPNGPGAPIINPVAIAKGIDKVIFTAHDVGNRLVGIYFESAGSVGLESVYLLNE